MQPEITIWKCKEGGINKLISLDIKSWKHFSTSDQFWSCSKATALSHAASPTHCTPGPPRHSRAKLSCHQKQLIPSHCQEEISPAQALRFAKNKEQKPNTCMYFKLHEAGGCFGMLRGASPTRDTQPPSCLSSSPTWAKVCPAKKEQNGRGWEDPRDIVQSNPPAKPASPQEGHTGTHHQAWMGHLVPRSRWLGRAEC